MSERKKIQLKWIKIQRHRHTHTQWNEMNNEKKKDATTTTVQLSKNQRIFLSILLKMEMKAKKKLFDSKVSNFDVFKQTNKRFECIWMMMIRTNIKMDFQQ